jgi:hypothetical protein
MASAWGVGTMATIQFGFLFAIGFVIAIALLPLLARLAVFCVAVAVLAVIATLAGAVVWWAWINPGDALVACVMFGFIPGLVLLAYGFDRSMVWLQNTPRRRQRDFAHQLETNLQDAGYYVPRREPRLLPPLNR